MSPRSSITHRCSRVSRPSASRRTRQRRSVDTDVSTSSASRSCEGHAQSVSSAYSLRTSRIIRSTGLSPRTSCTAQCDALKLIGASPYSPRPPPGPVCQSSRGPARPASPGPPLRPQARAASPSPHAHGRLDHARAGPGPPHQRAPLLLRDPAHCEPPPPVAEDSDADEEAISDAPALEGPPGMASAPRRTATPIGGSAAPTTLLLEAVSARARTPAHNSSPAPTTPMRSPASQRISARSRPPTTHKQPITSSPAYRHRPRGAPNTHRADNPASSAHGHDPRQDPAVSTIHTGEQITSPTTARSPLPTNSSTLRRRISPHPHQRPRQGRAPTTETATAASAAPATPHPTTPPNPQTAQRRPEARGPARSLTQGSGHVPREA